MDAGLDSGNILMQSEVPIEAHETAGDLHDKLAQLGAKMVVEYLHNHAHIQAYPQAETGITYAHKIEKAEAKINWQEEASIIARKIRGFNPAPGCFTYLDGQLIKIWHAQSTLSNTKALPGSIISTDKQALLVACGNNTTLAIQELQEAGRTRQEVSQYLQGHPDLVGKTFLVE
ncbi:MAG: methionyl-tRNA formyltransferase, partial [Burkholderiales bacterium]